MFLTSLWPFWFVKTDYNFCIWIRILSGEETVERTFLALVKEARPTFRNRLASHEGGGESLGRPYCPNQSLPKYLSISTKYLSPTLASPSSSDVSFKMLHLWAVVISYSPNSTWEEDDQPLLPDQRTRSQGSPWSDVLGERRCCHGRPQSPDGRRWKQCGSREKCSLSSQVTAW